MSNYTQRKFNIDERHDRAITKRVEAMGGNVSPSYFVNLALEAYLGDEVAQANGAGAHQVDVERGGVG